MIVKITFIPIFESPISVTLTAKTFLKTRTPLSRMVLSDGLLRIEQRMNLNRTG